MIMFLLNPIFCHLVGDYVLQSDFLAKTKGENRYHLFVHSLLYTLPFYLLYGLDGRFIALFLSHFLIDEMKAKWNMINYFTDQVLHYIIAILLYGILKL